MASQTTDIQPQVDASNFTTAAPAPPAAEDQTRTAELGTATARARSHHASTLAIHADDNLRRVQDIAPPIHLTSTFHYSTNPSDLYTVRERRAGVASDGKPIPAGDEEHVYSRESTHNVSRLETILQALLHGDTIVYSSGLSALHAVYILLKPRRVAISGGYHGAHAVLSIQQRMTGVQIVSLDEADTLSKGDILHVETPVNPTGEARDLSFYAAKAKATGAYLLVDATFAPPPLQDPFAHGADIVMHSGTKYFGGHSDLLCGVLATKNEQWATQLRNDRAILGSVMGGLEAWLVIRSLRTLELRVDRASVNVAHLVSWLESERCRSGSEVSRLVTKVLHASLQPEAQDADSWLRKQMPCGWGPVFAFVMRDRESARRFPTLLKLFQHATSLGGVESLVEWRAMSDDMVEEGLIRVSVGVEYWEDLRDDLRQGFARAVEDDSGRGK